ncbi:MAG: site-2 protease family protein [candidate division WOR-3 bacterium]
MESLIEILKPVFEIENIKKTKRGIFFIGNFTVEENYAIEYIKENFKTLGAIPSFSRDNNKIEIGVFPLVKETKIDFLTPAILFSLTILTTLFAGSIQAGANPFKNPYDLLKGIPFSFSLMTILLFHEMGHFLTSRYFKVQASPPYFLPVPHPLLGTFGAFIKMKSPVPTRKALLFIGSAGPLTGFAIALPITIIGLKFSKPVSLEEVKGALSLGNSIIFKILASIFAPGAGKGKDLLLHPMAFAGWIGMWVTALNLLPLSQLDGGHIIYSLIGKKSKYVAMITILIMLFLGLLWPGWILWAIIPLFLGLDHPPPLDGLKPIGKKEKIISFLCFLVFILTFIPSPFNVVNIK